MSDENQAEGQGLYRTGDPEMRGWFECQWRIWPRRADEKFTTNLSFHYGGVLAFRELHSREPLLSDQFREHVEWMDRQHAEAGLREGRDGE